MPLLVITRADADAYVCVVDGRLDTAASEVLEPVAKDAFLARSKRLVFDVTAVEFIASRGMGLMAAAVRTFPGKVYIVGANTYVRMSFQTTRLDQLFAFRKTVDAALAD